MWKALNAACVVGLCAGVLGAVNTAAAQSESPAVGYYRVERTLRLHTPPGAPAPAQAQLQLQQQAGTLDWQSQAGLGAPAHRRVDSPPEHQCVSASLQARDWRAVLAAVCRTATGAAAQRCGTAGAAPAVRVRALARDQWELTYPLQLVASGGGDATSPMAQAMSDPRLQQGSNPAERAQMQAALAQMPGAAGPAQAQAQAADIAEQAAADAAARGETQEAQLLREEARRLRGGNAAVMQGEAVERWVRVADRCPG